jgi:tetratricopeptide (TPR) repeat protein
MNARPESLEAMIGKGFDQLKLGQYEDAIDAFSAALAVYPDTAKAFLGRGISRFQIKKWKEAEGDFRRARELDAGDPESHVGLGLSLAMQDHIYPALEVLEKLLADFPNFVRGYIQLGTLHIKIGTINKGRDYL